MSGGRVDFIPCDAGSEVSANYRLDLVFGLEDGGLGLEKGLFDGDDPRFKFVVGNAYHQSLMCFSFGTDVYS